MDYLIALLLTPNHLTVGIIMIMVILSVINAGEDSEKLLKFFDRSTYCLVTVLVH